MANNGNENGDGLFPRAEVVPLVSEDRETDVSNIERAGHIIEALNYYDSVATVESDLRKFNNQEWLKERQAEMGKNIVYKWRRQKHEKHQKLLDGAEAEFREGYPLDMLTAKGMSQEEAETELTRRYGIFHDAYRGTSQGRIAKRQAVRAEYEQYIGSQQLQVEQADEQHIVEAPEFPPADPDRKVSLARALRSEFLQHDPAEYSDISDEFIGRISPEFFHHSLINVKARTPNARWCDSDKGQKSDRVYTVFVPGEWSTMLRSDPEYIADAAFNKSETTQRKLPPEERDTEASQRARVSVNLDVSERMRTYVATDLNTQLDALARFTEAAQYNGGLARFGNEANMREQLDYFWGTIIGDMVWATRIVNGWTYEQEDQVLRGLKKAIHFAPTPAERLDRFMQVVEVAQEWISARKNHMESMALQAEYYADKQREERRERLAQHLPDLLK